MMGGWSRGWFVLRSRWACCRPQRSWFCTGLRLTWAAFILFAALLRCSLGRPSAAIVAP
jgi:hypothetical protein